jgi:hypothetical protein
MGVEGKLTRLYLIIEITSLRFDRKRTENVYVQTVDVTLIISILTEQICSKNAGSIGKTQNSIFQIWVILKSASSSVSRI